MEISEEYKKRVIEAIFEARKNFTGKDPAFSKSLGINNSIYNRIKNGESTKGLLASGKWISIGRKLDVQLYHKVWVTAKTEVFLKIEKDITNCKNNSTALIFVDECGIGKTYSARQVVKTLSNAFYIDCSQAKTKSAFIRSLAKSVGVNSTGNYTEVKEELKYALTNIIRPVIVLDEAGDLEYKAYLELKELWNATEKMCGWYMMGADGLRKKIEQGISSKRVGYKEIFDRFNNKYMFSVPTGIKAKEEFYSLIISEVLIANLPKAAHYRINELVPKILGSDISNPGSLRRTETFITEIKKDYEQSAYPQ
jgi:hypothetical protein